MDSVPLLLGGMALIGLLWMKYVPSDAGNLGSLLSVADPEGLRLLNKFYRLEQGRDQFAALSLGSTHYFLAGNPHGRKIVLVHGINVTGNIFPQFIEQLVGAGFYVLSYDLFGMGYSDSPGTKYNHQTYVNQLYELLNHVGWNEPVTVLGFSLGGGIATNFADAHPERVSKLILNAPSGLKKGIPLAGKIFEVPIIGDLLFYMFGMQLLLELGKKHWKGSIPEPYKTHFVSIQRLNFKFNPGFPRCYIKTIQNGPIVGQDQAFKRVGSSFGNRVLCIWARGDTTCDYVTEGSRFRECMPDAVFESLDGKHTILGEQPQETSQLISNFCK